MPQATALHDEHVALGGKMVDFAGWDMPLHYGSQVQEHHAVRTDAGMFDVSHMTVIDLEGDETRPFLRYLLANDVDKLRTPGKALYSCMLDPDGGVIDDLIVYYLREDAFRMVVNAATREKDLAWITQQALRRRVHVRERDDLAMIAVQGPNARGKTHAALPEAAGAAEPLKVFHAAAVGDWFIARTGYTGEDGYEIMVPNTAAVDLWRRLLEQGVRPCGLGARDTLRLEAGMNLYGTDMDETVSPLECGLAWTVAWEPAERAFIGREALEIRRRAGVAVEFRGLILEGKGVLRGHQRVITDRGEGVITSGGFSPTLNQSIALARVPAGASASCQVEIRGKLLPARAVRPPFVRNGRACHKPLDS